MAGLYRKPARSGVPYISKVCSSEFLAKVCSLGIPSPRIRCKEAWMRCKCRCEPLWRFSGKYFSRCIWKCEILLEDRLFSCEAEPFNSSATNRGRSVGESRKNERLKLCYAGRTPDVLRFSSTRLWSRFSPDDERWRAWPMNSAKLELSSMELSWTPSGSLL